MLVSEPEQRQLVPRVVFRVQLALLTAWCETRAHHNSSGCPWRRVSDEWLRARTADHQTR